MEIITKVAASKSLQLKFEQAVRMLSLTMPIADESTKKPTLFHGLRVGVYLYGNNYSDDIVLAGVLHDALEDTEISETEISNSFGDTVLGLVKASTKDDSIMDSIEKNNELIKRCVENGEDALIVKSADILDSFKWYSSQNNESELAYCMRNVNAIFEYKPDTFNDPIFDELKKWQK